MLAVSQARTRARSASCSGVSVKSTVPSWGWGQRALTERWFILGTTPRRSQDDILPDRAVRLAAASERSPARPRALRRAAGRRRDAHVLEPAARAGARVAARRT